MPVDITKLNRRIQNERFGMLRFETEGFNLVHGSTRDKQKAFRLTAQQVVAEESERLRAALWQEAPKDTGKFADGIYVDQTTSWMSELPQAQIRVKGEHAFLLPFIVKGTKAHEIPTGGSSAQMAKGYPLSFYWQNGPKGPGQYFFWSVWHPGTQPNDFVTRAKNRWMPGAKTRFQQAGLRIQRGSYVHYS